MRGLRKAVEETKHCGYDRGLKKVVLYRLDTEEVVMDTIFDSFSEFYDGYLVCGVCREPKSWREIKGMVEEKLEMEKSKNEYRPRHIDPSRWCVEDVVKSHKFAWERWPHGEADESWIDEDGYLCIRYADGDWYHYGLSALANEIVWW